MPLPPVWRARQSRLTPTPVWRARRMCKGPPPVWRACSLWRWRLAASGTACLRSLRLGWGTGLWWPFPPTGPPPRPHLARRRPNPSTCAAWCGHFWVAPTEHTGLRSRYSPCCSSATPPPRRWQFGCSPDGPTAACGRRAQPPHRRAPRRPASRNLRRNLRRQDRRLPPPTSRMGTGPLSTISGSSRQGRLFRCPRTCPARTCSSVQPVPRHSPCMAFPRQT
mmetsp:Transcript_18079/g.57217  ORF Transcript_18079/g.57217 Transcript_18079/m.57217 type:complete len:222 (+) Transcript_18079:1092-1757(+)